MAYHSLREFIERLKGDNELVRIKEKVSPVLEIAEITDRISKQPGGGKALLFENVEGVTIPVLINAFGSTKRMNAALGVQDIEKIPISNPVRIIGNIPYNITSPIIIWLIEQLDYWDDAFIMMQKEVGERLTAKVGTKNYSRLSVVVGVYLNMELCFTIPPDVFYPKPKVDSAIIKFTKKSNPIVPDDQYVKFNKIVKAAFSKRRKMLRNSLAGFDIPKEIKSEIDFTRRPETLTIQEFAKLLT